MIIYNAKGHKDRVVYMAEDFAVLIKSSHGCNLSAT